MAWTARYSASDYAVTVDSANPQSSVWPEYLQPDPNRLLIFERSKNASLVVFTLKKASLADADATQPIRVHWHSFGWTDAPHDNDVSWIEWKMAYGYSSRRVDDELLELRLSALPQRVARLRRHTHHDHDHDHDDAGHICVFIEIAGRDAVCRKVFVHSTDRRIGLPKVHYVDLYGTDEHTGELLHERIVP